MFYLSLAATVSANLLARFVFSFPLALVAWKITAGRWLSNLKLMGSCAESDESMSYLGVTR